MVARVCSPKYIHARFRNRIVRHFRVIEIVWAGEPLYLRSRTNFSLPLHLSPRTFRLRRGYRPFLGRTGGEGEKPPDRLAPPPESTKPDRNTIARNVPLRTYDAEHPRLFYPLNF